ncbi:MAG: hypothetical protein AAF490_16380 [Chloroflexota bacterium]
MSNFVPQFILCRYAAGEKNGRFQAATLFIDFAGFSSLTEKMFHYGQTGAEKLSQAIQLNFAPAINAVQQAGGIIPLFAGDSFTAIFPSCDGSKNAEQNAWAIIRQIMSQTSSHQAFNETPLMGVKVGIAQGEVKWGIVGGKTAV